MRDIEAWRKEVAAKYANKRFGSFVTSDNLYLRDNRWHITVKCDCGQEHEVMTSRLNLHRGCNCKALVFSRTHKYVRKERTCTFKPLEQIWPKVVKAGHKVMEKYNNAMA